MSEVVTLLAMDVGEKRVGLAIANSVARLPQAMQTVERGSSFWDDIKNLVARENVQQIVVGLPRNLEGKDTGQTARIRDFVESLKQQLSLPVAFQDEALTSWQAEEELAGNSKPYAKGQVDALSAVYILEDYLTEQYDGLKSNG